MNHRPTQSSYELLGAWVIYQQDEHVKDFRHVFQSVSNFESAKAALKVLESCELEVTILCLVIF